MPVYEFHCKDCGKPFEITRSAAEFQPTKVKCPSCSSNKVERRWTSVFTITSKKS